MLIHKYWHMLRKLYTSHVHDIVGLDINADFIKLIKINSDVTPNKVEHMDVISMPKGAMAKNQLQDMHLIANTLKDMFRNNHISTNNVAIAIPQSWTITKNITVNARMTMDEIESRVWIEANRHFSHLIGEIYLDFAIVGPVQHDSSRLEIMLVASRKDQVNPYLEVMRLANLNVKIVDVNNFALERALFLMDKSLLQSKIIALFNIDYSFMNLLILDDGHLIYANDQTYEPIPLQHLKIKTAERATADALSGPGSLGDNVENNNDNEFNITEPDSSPEMNARGFIYYLRHMIQFFYSSRHNIKIHKILLAGDYTLIPDLAHFVQEEMNIETQLYIPFQNMDIASNINKELLKEQAPALMLCCGLALSELK